MTCQRALSLIEDLIDGELSPAEAEQVKRHLDGCNKCRDEFKAAQRLKQLLQQIPGYDPGGDYWEETTRLIHARTIDVPPGSRLLPAVTTGAVGEHRNTLVRALVSLAASLFVLFSAILIGSNQSQEVSRMNMAEVPILATAPVSELLGGDGSPVITRAEQVQLAKGMLLMGSPGFLGRFAGLPDLTNTLE